MTREQRSQKRSNLYWRMENTSEKVRYYTSLLRDMSLRFDDSNSAGRLMMSDLCDTIKGHIEEMEQLRQALARLGG